MAELVDALDLGSSDESRGGSSPSARTIRNGAIRDDADAKAARRDSGKRVAAACTAMNLSV
jgi:hypothetical protein